MSAGSHARIAGWCRAAVALGVVVLGGLAPVAAEAQGPGIPASDPRRARAQMERDVHQYTAALAGIRHDVSIDISVARRYAKDPQTKSFKLHAEVRDRVPDEVRREGDPCFEILQQAFDLTLKAAPIIARSPRISDAELEEANRLVRAAKRLIVDADRCLEKLKPIRPALPGGGRPAPAAAAARGRMAEGAAEGWDRRQ